MKEYLRLVKKVLEEGKMKENRTKYDTLALPGAIFRHDMSEGFPLLTTKKMPYKLIKTELEFFIKGITDKKWLQDRGNHIWDEWANPEKAPYGHSEKAKQRMKKEKDLGPVYGFQWRHFNADYDNYDTNYSEQGVDQLKQIVEMLDHNPMSRRMVVSAWNPEQADKMALPPCHYTFQVDVIDDKLHLFWNQRSVDVMLGLPFNIASYATLLHLLAKESGFEEGRLVGHLGDTHIYENHIEGANKQLERDPKKYDLPEIETNNFNSIFEWSHDDTELKNYESYPKIDFDIAV